MENGKEFRSSEENDHQEGIFITKWTEGSERENINEVVKSNMFYHEGRISFNEIMEDIDFNNVPEIRKAVKKAVNERFSGYENCFDICHEQIDVFIMGVNSSLNSHRREKGLSHVKIDCGLSFSPQGMKIKKIRFIRS